LLNLSSFGIAVAGWKSAVDMKMTLKLIN